MYLALYGVMGLVVVYMASLGDRFTLIALEINDQFHAQITEHIAYAMSLYVAQTGTLPLSIGQISGATGLEYVAMYDTSQVEMATATAITGYNYQFSRAVVYRHPPLDKVAQFSYLNANSCDDGGLDAAYWCNNEDSYYAVFEDRHAFDVERALGVNQLNTTIYKLVKQVEVDGYPSRLEGDTVLQDGESVSLMVAVGYGGEAEDCTGVFVFDRAVLDCRDLFDRYGNPVIYQYISTYEASLTTTLPIVLSDGTYLTIGAQLAI